MLTTIYGFLEPDQTRHSVPDLTTYCNYNNVCIIRIYITLKYINDFIIVVCRVSLRLHVRVTQNPSGDSLQPRRCTEQDLSLPVTPPANFPGFRSLMRCTEQDLSLPVTPSTNFPGFHSLMRSTEQDLSLSVTRCPKILISDVVMRYRRPVFFLSATPELYRALFFLICNSISH